LLCPESVAAVFVCPLVGARREPAFIGPAQLRPPGAEQ
jgi:hypothetical protein